MKRLFILIAAASLLQAACAAHYVATDTVSHDLNGSRQVLSRQEIEGLSRWRKDSLSTPQLFDFRSDKDTMHYAYTINITRNGWTIQNDSLPKMLQPKVTISKSFRWFTTRYHYTARFPQLDSLPVPIDNYLSSDEQKLLFSPNELPKDWTGTDLYSVLDKVNSKYVKWWGHCLFEKEMEIYATLCDSSQLALLNQYHDTLLALVFTDFPNNSQSLSSVAKNIPELKFLQEFDLNNDELSLAAFLWGNDHWELNTRVLWCIELPNGHMAEHLISADRMILGDYVIEEHSDVINWWACALTLLILVGGVLLVRRKLTSGIIKSY